MIGSDKLASTIVQSLLDGCVHWCYTGHSMCHHFVERKAGTLSLAGQNESVGSLVHPAQLSLRKMVEHQHLIVHPQPLPQRMQVPTVAVLGLRY